MINWKSELNRELKVNLNSAILSFFVGISYFILQIIGLFLMRYVPIEYRFWLLIIPMLYALTAGLVFTFIKRNDPNHKAYYLFHLSPISVAILCVGVVGVILVYFIGQCNAYVRPFGVECIQGILSGELHNSFYR